MLEYLRNAAEKPLAKVLMFILIFSFVGWGAAEWIFSGVSRDTTLVHVGNADISVQAFNGEKSRQLSLMSKEDQRASYTDPAKAAQLTNSVMATITMNQLALNRAKDMGYVVSDKRIAREIRSYPQFQNNGEFTPWLFDMLLQNSGMTEQDFANSLRADVLRQMVVGAANVPVKVPQFAVDAAYNARYSNRDIQYKTVKFSAYKISDPTDEQLKTYYAQNPHVVPETRSVSYVFLSADMSKPDLYDEGFKKAQQIEDMIISGDTLKTAAEKHNAKYVQIADIKRGTKLSDKIMSDDLVAKIFAMESGTESEVLELKDGFVIVRVDSVVAEHNAEFEDVKKDLVAGWKKSEQRKQAYVAANDTLVDWNSGSNSFESDKHVKKLSVTRTEGAPLSVLNAAFAGKVGDNYLVEDTDAFHVLHIEKNIAPKSDDKKKATIRKELENLSSRHVMDDYSQFLKRHYPVKVNQKVFDRFIAK